MGKVDESLGCLRAWSWFMDILIFLSFHSQKPHGLEFLVSDPDYLLLPSPLLSPGPQYPSGDLLTSNESLFPSFQTWLLGFLSMVSFHGRQKAVPAEKTAVSQLNWIEFTGFTTGSQTKLLSSQLIKGVVEKDCSWRVCTLTVGLHVGKHGRNVVVGTQ